MTHSRCAAAMFCFTCATACADSRDGGRDEAFLLTDSAGVVIAESFQPAWGDGGGWRVAPEPELSIGAGATGGDDPDNPAFGWIRGVEVLSEGRIAVADATIAQVLVFDSSGLLTHRFGGEGEGPGELEDLGMLQKCAGDTLITADPYRFNFFDSLGNFIRTVRSGSASDPITWLVSRDCRSFLVSDQRMPDPVGEEGLDYIDLAWSDETFAVRDTVARVAFGQSQPMRRRSEGGQTFLAYPQVPWTMRMPFPVAHEDLIVGYGRWAELRAFGPDGRLKRIARWHSEPEPITGEDRRRFEDEKAACETRYQTRCRALEDFTWLPSHKFFFDKLLLDSDGNIWARSVSPTSLGSSDSNLRGDPRVPERWTVLASSGEWLGTVELPDGLALAQVANGRVYGVHRDELGIATVRVHRIEKSRDAS